MMKTGNYLVLLLGLMSLLTSAHAATPIRATFEEGVFLDGAEGVIRKMEKVDVWNFIPTSDIVDKESTWPARKPVSLLPCSVLEQITGLAGDDNEIHVRLWGLFTEYGQNNYLYSIYFLPVKEDAGLEVTRPAKPEQNKPDEPAPAEEEDSIIPLEILKQIKTARTPDLKTFQQVAAVTGDTNLIGRAGYLRQQDKIRFFQPDAFGQNIDPRQYMILPCGIGEETEKQMQKTPGKMRYDISGLVTQYKGRNYILLRRATRTFTNGNFTQ